MTEPLFHADAYLQEAGGEVRRLTPEGGIVLDRSLFYPTGGGQPGDSGWLDWAGGSLAVATTVKGEGGEIVLLPAVPAALPPVGTRVRQRLDWLRRHRHMRVHTALHLLCAVIPLPVTGGAIGAEKGRLDFRMPEPPADPAAIEAALGALIERDLVVREDWIDEAGLDANPALVRTLSVGPPRGQGKIRLVRIGEGADQVDLQPCGGTHVARLSEIGRLRLGRIENKGRDTRRVTIYLD
ncbi:alanyl-tRNA editing protein [Celeribacter indicus]|uniref:Alanine--tRNA ligase n=1 Tax=Celeribacter indicus TaxID=1208324 RepID=A0A0B5DTS1_9RHOB|nr:alanyl-tRNA editing protein [Celeribacter indicus]AJE46464.1 threonyl/alanyl tRNA synthetase [Celeribacter indicus]SDW57375.1 Ala-tRNA(Pro) hydrolase [Celeribacter indicus]